MPSAAAAPPTAAGVPPVSAAGCSGARRRVAVVLFNLGGPDSLEAVRPFLFNLFNDPAIIGLPWPARPLLAALISSRRNAEASANYALMGGASPLLRETEAQALALEAVAAEGGDEVRAFIAMRYWKPFTEETTLTVAEWGPDEVVLLPLYPQFSTTTSGSSLKLWAKSYRGPGRVRTICCWPELEGLVEGYARNIEAVWDAAGRPRDIRLLFSAHGLPEKIIEGGDPYQWQVERTSAAVAARLADRWDGPLDWRVCYQSRVGPLKWIGPPTPEAVEAAVKDGLGVILAPIAFVSEHVETLVELDREYAELAAHMNAPHYLRAPTVSVQRDFIAGLAAMVARALERPDGVESFDGARICPARWRRCPADGPAPPPSAPPREGGDLGPEKNQGVAKADGDPRLRGEERRP